MSENRKTAHNTKPNPGVRFQVEFFCDDETQYEQYLIAQVGPDAHMFIDLEDGNRYSDKTFERGEFSTVAEAFHSQTFSSDIFVITIL